MPGTARRKIGPRKVNREVPAWVEVFVETGQQPDRGTDDYDQFNAWRYFNDMIPGLPAQGSPEGWELQRRSWEREPDRWEPAPYRDGRVVVHGDAMWQAAWDVTAADVPGVARGWCRLREV